MELGWPVNKDDTYNKALITALINIQNDISKLNLLWSGKHFVTPFIPAHINSPYKLTS
jgi:hypothetical protein